MLHGGKFLGIEEDTPFNAINVENKLFYGNSEYIKQICKGFKKNCGLIVDYKSKYNWVIRKGTIKEALQKSIKPMYCAVCSAEFNNITALRNHIGREHTGSNQPFFSGDLSLDDDDDDDDDEVFTPDWAVNE